MINVTNLNQELIAARPYFKMLSPSWPAVLRGQPALYAYTFMRVKRLYNYVKQAEEGTPASAMIGGWLAGELLRGILKYPKRQVIKAHKIAQDAPGKDPFRKNGLGGRTWISEPGRYKMVIVFHDANRAGPHIDVHIGRMSVVYRVKPELYAQLKYNAQGELTGNSKKLIIEHVRQEIQGGSRVPQNLDHTVRNARATWYRGDPEATHYGAGRTRQVVSESEVDIYKAHKDGPIEMYAPVLSPYRPTYMYRLYPGDAKTAPILIWGQKSASPPKFQDRLHLKLVHPEDLEEHRGTKAIDEDATTLKYDGSSAYVVITPTGTTVWSPRTSKVHGNQIEYTPKLNGLAYAHTRNGETIVAMGEVMFKTKTKYPWEKSEYLPQAAGSGILNSNSVVPDDVDVEIRLYRVDRVGRSSTVNQDFWTNRELQYVTADLYPSILKVVELGDHEESVRRGFEGVVTIPYGGSVNDGYKTKWWLDAADWRIDSVDFYPGERGGIAGVVRATSLESGKEFNLGPGQVGNRELTEAMMNNPERYEGAVLKVHSRHGHEGRGAKVVSFHDDRGLAPY